MQITFDERFTRDPRGRDGVMFVARVGADKQRVGCLILSEALDATFGGQGGHADTLRAFVENREKIEKIATQLLSRREEMPLELLIGPREVAELTKV
ncbi:MAG TPA: DUF1488 family protein [Thermoanaerobaculia bacterium]|nr:DUF1488 family protein [Thermoanaerobaculia bacterium]